MYLKVLIFSLSCLGALAYPVHHNTRVPTDLKANQAHDKTELTKEVEFYKSHIEDGGLYSQEDVNKKPLAEVMQHKLNMESERLRARLLQELAELRERLSPTPARLTSTLATMRERLAPLTQQLHSSLSSNTQDLCDQLSVYLQGLDTVKAQTEASPSHYQEAFRWMSQTLEHSGSKLADIISDFQTKTVGVIEHLKEISVSEEEAAKSGLWQEVSSRLGQEVSLLRAEAQNRVRTFKAEQGSLLETAQPLKAEVTASTERFCQNAAQQSQVFQARVERMFDRLKEELGVQEAPGLSPSSSSAQADGSLQEDFSVKLSALIQDILHSVQ